MLAVPKDVYADGTDIYVGIPNGGGSINTVMRREQLIENGLPVPRTPQDAQKLAARLKRDKTPLLFSSFRTPNSDSVTAYKRHFRGKYKGGLPPALRKAEMEKRRMKRRGIMKATIEKVTWGEQVPGTEEGKEPVEAKDTEMTQAELAQIFHDNGAITLLNWQRKEKKIEIKYGSDDADRSEKVAKATKVVEAAMKKAGIDISKTEIKWSD